MNSEEDSSNQWQTVKFNKKKYKKNEEPMKAFFIRIKKELDEEFKYLNNDSEKICIDNKDKKNENRNTSNIFYLLKDDDNLDY